MIATRIVLRSMQLKHLLLNSTVRSFQRSYVSVVSVNVNSFKAVKVKSKDNSDSSDEVKLTLFDGQQKEVDPEDVPSLNILITKDSFKMECSEPKDLSAELEIPVLSTEVEVAVSAEKSSVNLETLQAKSIEIDVKTGDVSLKNIKSVQIKVNAGQGNVSTKGFLVGANVHVNARNGVSLHH